MHERQSDGRRPVGLEAEHWLAPALDGPVILFDDVVQVATLSHPNVFPSVVLPTEPTQTRMTRPLGRRARCRATQARRRAR